MFSQPEKETVNWTKGSTALVVTKIALCSHIVNTLKNELQSGKYDEIAHSPDLLKLNERVCNSFHKFHTYFSIKKIRQRVQRISTEDYDRYHCCICKDRNCPFDRIRHGGILFEEEAYSKNVLVQLFLLWWNDGKIKNEVKKEIINQYYWQIAILFMFQGSETNEIPNTGPEDTDSTLIFKMMKDCKLFPPKNDEYDNVYDYLISFRNSLMQNANQHLSDEALDTFFNCTIMLLNAKQFSEDTYCQLALVELSKLKDLKIIIPSLSNEGEKLIRQALTEQQGALEYDISVKGFRWYLKGILELSEQKSRTREYISERDSNITILRCAETETANWTKASTGLVITKTALCNNIIRIWKSELKCWEPDAIAHLPDFLQDIKEDEVAFLNEEGSKRKIWKINCKCPSKLCERIFNNLRKYHGHDSRKIVWNPISKDPPGKRSKLFVEKVQKVSKKSYIEHFEMICYICKKKNCPFERNRNGVPLFEDKKITIIDKYYWQIANMFMFRGSERNVIPNTRPEDTDAALIFKMMKNCTLFDLGKDEDDVYDDLLEVRNFLMHNADQRLSDEALEECFSRMKTLLETENFRHDNHCKLAVVELSKLKDMVLAMSSLSTAEEKLLHQAFTDQQGALKHDISVEGFLKDEHYLEDILKANEQKIASGNYVKSEKLVHESASQTMDKDTRTSPLAGKAGAAAGVATGAALGTIAGPIGAAVGGVCGGVLGLAQSIKQTK